MFLFFVLFFKSHDHISIRGDFKHATVRRGQQDILLVLMELLQLLWCSFAVWCSINSIRTNLKESLSCLDFMFKSNTFTISQVFSLVSCTLRYSMMWTQSTSNNARAFASIRKLHTSNCGREAKRWGSRGPQRRRIKNGRLMWIIHVTGMFADILWANITFQLETADFICHIYLGAVLPPTLSFVIMLTL